MPFPLVHDGVMFLQTFPDAVLAIDATNGQVLWRFEYEFEGSSSQKMGLAIAGKRRVLRETVQARAVRKVTGHISAPCSELPQYDGLEQDRAVVDALSEALLSYA